MPTLPISATADTATRLPHRSWTPSRRSLLFGAAAGAGVVMTPTRAFAGRPVSSSLPLVKPLPSQKVLRTFGVNAQPNALQSGYAATDDWMAAIDAIGFTYFRGMYAPGLPATLDVVANAREMGLRWGMQVARDIDADPAAIVAAIRHIGDNAADRCVFIEGLNEPNNIRGVNTVPPDWKTKTINIQRTIYQAVRSDPRLNHVVVLGPSLRDVSASTQDYLDLAAMGMCSNMDYSGMHRYPNGNYPSLLMADRQTMLQDVWPSKPVWITEHGYTNALASVVGQRAVPEDVAAAYAPSSLLEAADRGMNMAWYEVLDEPNPAKDDVESNFGLFGTSPSLAGPPWRPKPVVGALTDFLSLLKDPGPGFNTPRIRLGVTSNMPDVRNTVTMKRDGSVMVHLRRATNCWDPKAQAPIAVTPAEVVISTPTRTLTVSVDHHVTSVQL